MTSVTALKPSTLDAQPACSRDIAPSVSKPEAGATTWRARLELQLDHTARGTRLTRAAHVGPLYVQKPFYPEGPELAHLYPLHPPGGVVSGDDLHIEVNASDNAQVLLTTPGAARIYRARPDALLQAQQVDLRVGVNASLEWLPLETIVYPGANTALQTRVDLAEGGRFIGWEVTSLGLPASDQAFSRGQVQQRFHIYQNNRPVFIEKLSLGERQSPLFDARAGMQSQPISGVFVAGPFALSPKEPLAESLMTELRDAIADFTQGGALAGISVCGDFVVGRYLGGCSEAGRELFIRWWQLLRPELLDRAACPPRIWLT